MCVSKLSSLLISLRTKFQPNFNFTFTYVQYKSSQIGCMSSMRKFPFHGWMCPYKINSKNIFLQLWDWMFGQLLLSIFFFVISWQLPKQADLSYVKWMSCTFVNSRISNIKLEVEFHWKKYNQKCFVQTNHHKTL